MFGGWRVLGVFWILHGGCVSQAMYDAKLAELDQLRARESLVQQRITDRIDRLSARLGEIEKQIGQSDARTSELSRSVQLVRDLTVQIDQNVQKQSVPREVRCDFVAAPPQTLRAKKQPVLFPSKKR